LKIGIVSRYPPVHCGVAEYTRFLIRGLKGAYPDLQVVVFSSREASEEPYVDEELGVKIVPSFSIREESYSMLIENIASHGKFDVIHVQHEYGIFGYRPGIVSTLIRAKEENLAKAVVFTMHTVHHESRGEKDAVLTQALLSEVDSVIVHSVLQEFELLSQSIEPVKIRRIPHGTLINPFLGYPKQKLAKLAGIEAEISDRDFLLVAPGFLRHDKGFDVLSEAVRGLRGVRIIVAGKRRDKSPNIQGIVSDNITLIERYLTADEILALVALADAIVLPYREKPGRYSVSGVLHLSMGSLKPIIGTRVSRLVELYERVPRLTTLPERPEQLRALISWVRQNYDLAVTYSSSIYSYATTTQWLHVARSHVLLYKELIGHRESSHAVLPFDREDVGEST